mgnify:FL=1
MSDTISNDYVSMINKTGSGYNIPVIVDAIVDAEISAVKEIVTAKKDKVDAAISGMAVLKSSMQVSQANVTTIMGQSHLSLGVTPNSDYVSASISDHSALTESSNILSDVTIAKPFIFEMPGFSSATYAVQNARSLSVKFGEYSSPSNPTFDGFTQNGNTTTISVSVGDTLTEIAAQLDAIVGVSAKVVQKSASGSAFSLLITSETGAQNAISIDDSDGSSSEANMFKTASGGSYPNSFIQSATDAAFKFNGVDISRETNTVTDLVAGLHIKLLSNVSGDQIIQTSLSQSNIQQNVESLIGELNAYKADLNALGFVDEVGDESGQLANNAYLRSTKQKLMNLMTAPITGFGEADIHFVEFGIKTAVDGSYVFDQTTFDRTFLNAPEKFDALTQDKAYASDPNVFVYAATDSDVPSGKHTFTDSDDKLNAGTTGEKSMSFTGSGPFAFSTPDYPGFVFETASSTPGDLSIYVGRSAKTKLFDFFSEALASTGNHETTVAGYEDRSSSLESKLTKIDQREALLQAMYTKRFSEMEKAVNVSTSSEEYITQLVDGWNKS